MDLKICIITIIICNVELYNKALYTYISNTFKVMVVCQYASNNQYYIIFC